jgi:hypothetical protein
MKIKITSMLFDEKLAVWQDSAGQFSLNSLVKSSQL